MKPGYPRLAGALGGIVVVAGVFSGLAQPVGATPSPVASDVPISVIIPEPSATSTPTPSPSPSSSSRPGSQLPTESLDPDESGTGSGSGNPECDVAVDGKPPAVLAKPYEEAGELTLDPETVAAEESVVLRGSGYTPDEVVQVAMYSGAVELGSHKADASGNLVARIRIPVETRPGEHILQATGWDSCVSNSATFSVTANASATSIPYTWWLLAVLALVLLVLAVIALYYRDAIRQWFGGGLRPGTAS